MIGANFRHLAVLTVLACTVDAQAEGLNCRAGLPPVENAVCSDTKLRRLDADAVSRYEKVTSAMAEAERRQLAGYHDSWLSARSVCGTDLSCLKTVYKNWLSLLNHIAH